ncbi:MAG: hypothetical protein PHP97_03275 [Candidatus Shapirobacteria bacterium]|nr:hypothetical protein [Candidatus Shapirobacteria bacterium]MDD3002554.1 hypothetical protein [Candidatus Shapirobacteria bacterium]MDD4383077.1 hypothetical protein [Candidatus Shapirobacteria bacterium]
MENSGEFSPQIPREILSNKQDKWLNLLGEDTRKRGYESMGGNTESIYEPKPRSLVDKNGFSCVSSDYFKETLITPIREKKSTEMVVPLNKIIALDTTEKPGRMNNNSTRLPWEIDSHTSVEEFRRLIKENKFDFNDASGLYGLELPGGYFLATGGRHRLTAMFLENVSEVKLQVNKIKDPKEFEFTEHYHEHDIQEGLNNGKIKGKIEENSDHSKKLVLEEPLKNPLQLFDYRVSDELLDVLAQTLSTS